MKTNLYVLSLIVLCLNACAKSSTDEKINRLGDGIVGGRETAKTHLTSRYLALIFDKPTESYCTAMLIRKNILLTAAHCIKSNVANLTVAFGNRPMAGQYVMHEASRILVHPQYKNQSIDRNDLALILLKSDAPKGYEPLAIPNETFPLKAGQTFTASGYGKISGISDPHSPDHQGSGYLRHVELKVDSISADQSQFYVDQSQGKGICNGDSGGPAMMRLHDRDYAIGIASAISWLVPSELSDKAKKEYMEKQDVCAHRSIYINTKNYHTWIEDGIKELIK